MRKTGEIAHHCRQIASRLGRRTGMSSGGEAGEFSLAHMVAFQYAILHPVSSGDGIDDLRTDHAPAVASRKSAHPFYDRRTAGMKSGFPPVGYVGYHSECSEESLISCRAIPAMIARDVSLRSR